LVVHARRINLGAVVAESSPTAEAHVIKPRQSQQIRDICDFRLNLQARLSFLTAPGLAASERFAGASARRVALSAPKTAGWPERSVH
jgi:hypothetical protein